MTYRRASVLVVDDDPDMREILRLRLPNILAQVGLEDVTLLVSHGVESAKTLLGTHRPTLVISDHRMRDGKGYDILMFLLAQNKGETQFAMMTDSPEAVRDDARFPFLGENRLLAKPAGTGYADFVPWIRALRKVLNGK